MLCITAVTALESMRGGSWEGCLCTKSDALHQNFISGPCFVTIPIFLTIRLYLDKRVHTLGHRTDSYSRLYMSCIYRSIVCKKARVDYCIVGSEIS